jgi:cholest-4-en-3-one 26-monooxygenase
MNNIAVDLLSPETFARGVPHDIFDQLRTEAPVYRQDHPEGGAVWSLTRYTDIARVSRDVETFTSTLGFAYPNIKQHVDQMKGAMIYNDPPEHTRLRRYAGAGFSVRVVAQFDAWVRELAIEVIEKIHDMERFDFVEQISSELPGLVIAAVMGVPREDRRKLARWAHAATSRMEPNGGAERAAKAQAEAFSYIAELGAEKRRHPGEDMTSSLAMAEVDGVKLTDDEFVKMVYSLLAAAVETTNALIAHTQLLFIRQPEIRERVKMQPPDQMMKATDELLRLITPAMHMGRTATRDVVIGDQHIGKGDFVMMWMAAGNRDPEVFSNPHGFNPDRSPNRHQTFGAGGPHFCIGNQLARLEGKIFVEEWLKRGIELELDGEPVQSYQVINNTLLSLPVRVKSR